MNRTNNPLKIDIVYTWVNDKDEEWKIQKNIYQSQYNSYEESTTDERFTDEGLLKYSLRSVEKYAPWINHVYIITANQIPDWLNTNNPKVSVIFHKDIMPADILPTFNSNAIELCMDNIPNLSEYFLYSNDDTFFGDFVEPSFFYKNKKVICRFDKEIKDFSPRIYKDMLMNSIKCFDNSNLKIPKNVPHHNIDAYKKSLITKCKEKFKKEINETIHNKFRTNNDLQRIIFNLYAIATKQGYMKKIYQYDTKKPFYKKFIKSLFLGSPNDSVYFNYKYKNIEYSLEKYKPKLFCLNSHIDATEEEISIIKTLLEQLFPQKSSFENT